MNKIISPKIIALTFGILVVSFAVAFYVIAWQEPSQAPPGGNVPAPLNVGPTGQSKSGGLILNTGGAEYGLIIDKGKVCIGTDCRDKWPAAGISSTGLYGWVYILRGVCQGSLPPATCEPGCAAGYRLVNTGSEAGSAGWWGGGGVIGRYYSCYKQ